MFTKYISTKLMFDTKIKRSEKELILIDSNFASKLHKIYPKRYGILENRAFYQDLMREYTLNEKVLFLIKRQMYDPVTQRYVKQFYRTIRVRLKFKNDEEYPKHKFAMFEFKVLCYKVRHSYLNYLRSTVNDMRFFRNKNERLDYLELIRMLENKFEAEKIDDEFISSWARKLVKEVLVKQNVKPKK